MVFRRRTLSLAIATLLLSSTATHGWATALGTPVVFAQHISIEDRETEADRLYHDGSQLLTEGQYQNALEYFQQALDIYRELGYRQEEALILFSLGKLYYDQNQYSQSIEFYQQSLDIAQKIGNQQREWFALNGLGIVHHVQSQYQQAIDFHQRALSIAYEMGDSTLETNSLVKLGLAHYYLSQYQQSIHFYQQAINLADETTGFSKANMAALINLADVYEALGEYQQALEFYQRGLEISQQRGDRHVEAHAFNGLAAVYSSLKQNEEALKLYHQSLAIRRDIGDRRGESVILIHLGEIYRALGENEHAIDLLGQSLTITEETNSLPEKVYALTNLGDIYVTLNQSQEALEFYKQALTGAQEIGVREIEAYLLSAIAQLLTQQHKSALAIVFYKQAVNVREEIRQDIQGLSQEIQRSYTESIANTYRELADLLLQQDRVLEAQQVLDLLKVQELDDYLHYVRGNTKTANGVSFWQPEQEVINHFEDHQQTAIKLGQELAELRQIPEGDRTPTQTHRIDKLVQLEQDINRQFNDFIDSDEILELINQLSVTTQQQTLNLADVNGLRDDLAQLNAVLLYPLILDDRLELVITTPNTPPLRRTVEVSKEELNQTILEFRLFLQTPTRSATVPAQKLYRWLIEPLEQDLAAADIGTIIYAPDGQLRYIPLAALHDGDRYLIETYAVNNITARSLTNLDRQPKANPSVLAGAFADEEQVYPVQLGQRSIDFRGLPFAGEEVKTLTSRLPNITSFMDHEFSLEAVRSRLNEHDILHFATHAAFVPGIPEDSFILFGNGDKSTLADVRDWSLQNVDLVVLSACQTGLGGFGNGEEILGLGYQFQRAGARAAIASLWQVSDRGTQVLMEAFYTALQNGYSKAEALRRAQQALITGDSIVLAEEQGTTMEMIDPATDRPSSRNDLSHPYYWAPFILIGNGL